MYFIPSKSIYIFIQSQFQSLYIFFTINILLQYCKFKHFIKLRLKFIKVLLEKKGKKMAQQVEMVKVSNLQYSTVITVVYTVKIHINITCF